jgi:hypothetical protein
MIITALLNIFYLFIYALTSPLRLLSDVSLPTDLTNAISTASTYLTAIDFILPVSTFLIIFSLIFGIETFILLYKLINWVIHKIPTIS